LASAGCEEFEFLGNEFSLTCPTQNHQTDGILLAQHRNHHDVTKLLGLEQFRVFRVVFVQALLRCPGSALFEHLRDALGKRHQPSLADEILRNPNALSRDQVATLDQAEPGCLALSQLPQYLEYSLHHLALLLSLDEIGGDGLQRS